MLRALILVPIAHSEEDMGTLGKRLQPDQTYRRLAYAHWSEIKARVQALEVDWSTVKVYQDGLPDAGAEIVQKILAEVQSPNYDLLRWLVAQGAELIGTESPSLLNEEYGLLRAVLATTDAAASARARRIYRERAGSLLAERDAYIARRIMETLLAGGVGLLFVGQAHQVAGHLPAEVAVSELPADPTPPATHRRQARSNG